MPCRPALDPVALLADAVRLTLVNRIAYARTAGVPFALCVALLLWAAFRDGPPLVALAAAALSLLIMLPVATAWHRFVILGGGKDREWLQLRLGAAEWRYVLTWAKIGLLTASLTVPLALYAAPPPGVPALAVLSAIAAIIVPTPFLLAAPAAAVDEPARLRDAEILSRGQRLRLLTLAVLLAAVGLLVGMLAAAVATAGGSGLVGAVISELAAYVLLPIWTGALSLAYLKLSPLAPVELDSAGRVKGRKWDYPSG
jgi:hypothetical protein